jgi:hypothetical protein
MTSWGEKARHDPALRAFIDGEIGRAVVELAALKVEHERGLQFIASLTQERDELRAELGKKKGK